MEFLNPYIYYLAVWSVMVAPSVYYNHTSCFWHIHNSNWNAHFFYGQVDAHCSNAEVRLEGGLDKFGGRLEVCSQHMWHTVCSYSMWSTANAKVVCKQLGYSDQGAVMLTDGTYSKGLGSIFNSAILCSGREDRLLDCINYPDITLLDCTHTNDVGLRCSPSKCQDGEVRLANSTAGHTGRVEVCVGQQWGSVCDDHWDRTDATVVCKQLGFSTDGVIAVSFGYFGEAHIDPILMDNVECVGNETTISECSHSSEHNCVHREDAGVICKAPCVDGSVQLGKSQASHHQQVEVCVNQQWTSVCDKNWSSADATVTCRQLGYTGIGHAPLRSPNTGHTVKPIALSGFECRGDEKRLVDCSIQNTRIERGCDHSDNVGVICHGNSNLPSITTRPGPNTYSTTDPVNTTPSSVTLGQTRVGTNSVPRTSVVIWCSEALTIIVGGIAVLLLILLIVMAIVTTWIVAKLSRKSRTDPRGKYSEIREEREVENPLYDHSDDYRTQRTVNTDELVYEAPP